ncbi:MAG: transposase [bacterium]|nr:transposase [bacterium]
MDDAPLQAYHITWVTHNSRISPRMIENEAVIHRLRIRKGINPLVEPTWLDERLEVEISECIAEIVKEYKLRIIAYNICGDHVHIILICSETDRAKIVGILKGKSTFLMKKRKQVTDELHLWAQKYSWTLIESDDQLSNTINYISNNRQKHELPDNIGLNLQRDAIIGDSLNWFLCNKGLEPLAVGTSRER